MKIAPMNVDLVDHMGTDLTAQAETRDVASLIAREVELLFPVSWNALMGGVG